MRTVRVLMFAGIGLVAAGIGAHELGFLDGPRPPSFCQHVRMVGEQRAADVTDPAAIDRLVAGLPGRFKDDAALWYYPYGGSVNGLNTSGINAEAAGRRLNDYYADTCSFRPPN